MVAAYDNIDDRVLPIQRLDKLTEQFAEVKKTYNAHEKRYALEVSHLKDIAAKHALKKPKLADVLAYASVAVLSLVVSCINARDEIRDTLRKYGKIISTERFRSDHMKA